MRLVQLLSRAKHLAEVSGVLPQDFLYIISETLHISIPQLYLLKDSEVTPFDSALLTERFERLCRHEAPQYICGTAHFYGHELMVTPATLIPRPETEGLVELVLRSTTGCQRVLDIGTGSGAIAIAIKKAKPELIVDAIDISPEALNVAKDNAAKLGAEISFYEGDLFPPQPVSYNIIVSNPPYISAEEYELLDLRVKDQEPMLALKAGIDGLDVYRVLLAKAGDYLLEGGMLFLEHGNTQQPALISLAGQCGWTKTTAYTDLSGRNRYLKVEK